VALPPPPPGKRWAGKVFENFAKVFNGNLLRTLIKNKLEEFWIFASLYFSFTVKWFYKIITGVNK